MLSNIFVIIAMLLISYSAFLVSFPLFLLVTGFFSCILAIATGKTK